MIHGHTLNGTKNLTLRGWKGPRGLKGFAQGRITTASGDKIFWDGSVAGLTVTADPAFATGAVAVDHTISVSTSIVTITPAGGSAPYAFVWSLVSDDGLGGTWTANPSASGSASQFRASAVPTGLESAATFLCTVTDARGATGTVSVTAYAQNFGSIGF